MPLISELELAWQRRASAPLVAVTGSNGKSTVTVLVAEMLRAAGVSAVAGGNLGPPASELVLGSSWDAWVLEVSSFQGELLVAMRPSVGVFLNFSQDHLERHPSMDAYLAAKRRLFTLQSSSDAAILNADDPSSAATPTAARTMRFSTRGAADAWLDGDGLMLGTDLLATTSHLAIGGLHNVSNALAAALAARELGADDRAIRRALESFEGLEHRHQTVHRDGGVRWIDDSKATNVGAVLAALAGYPERSVHLILGGLGKGQDFAPLCDELGRVAARVYLIGADAHVIASVITGCAPLEDCTTLDEAVQRARRHARSGQTVLLAPGCASFDQFAGYAERGTRFAELARRGVAACR